MAKHVGFRELTIEEKADMVGKIEHEGGLVDAFIYYGLDVSGTELDEPVTRLAEALEQIEDIIRGYTSEVEDYENDVVDSDSYSDEDYE